MCNELPLFPYRLECKLLIRRHESKLLMQSKTALFRCKITKTMICLRESSTNMHTKTLTTTFSYQIDIAKHLPEFSSSLSPNTAATLTLDAGF